MEQKLKELGGYFTVMIEGFDGWKYQLYKENPMGGNADYIGDFDSDESAYIWLTEGW